jgi:hypothetical protein
MHTRLSLQAEGIRIKCDKLVLTSRGALLGEREYCSSKPRKKPTCQGQSDHLGPVSLT